MGDSSDSVPLAHRIDLSSLPTPNVANVRLNGFFGISYIDAYAASWRRLVNMADQLAIPIMYLQRHTLELIVKELILSLLGTRDEEMIHQELFGPSLDADTYSAEVRDWEADWTLVQYKHRFDMLFECVKKNLKRFQLPELPIDFDKAKELLDNVERGDETRLRYETVRRASKWRTWGSRTNSFDSGFSRDMTVAPIGELSELMTRIVSEHYKLGEEFQTEQSSFLDHVASKNFWTELSNAGSCQRLEEATRTGQMVWKSSAEPLNRLENHPDFEGYERERILEEHLVAEHNGRRFVLLTVANAERTRDSKGISYRNMIYLAHQRADGTLSRAVIPYYRESNLEFAASGVVRALYPGISVVP